MGCDMRIFMTPRLSELKHLFSLVNLQFRAVSPGFPPFDFELGCRNVVDPQIGTVWRPRDQHLQRLHVTVSPILKAAHEVYLL